MLRPRPGRRRTARLFKVAPVGESRSVAAGKPWWRLTKTPRQGFLLGAIWTLLGLGQLLSGLSRSGDGVNLALGSICLMLAVCYLASAAAQLRRERSHTAAGGPDQPGPARP